MKKYIKEFIHHEASGGIVLTAAAALALICANTGLEGWYIHAVHDHISLQVGGNVLNITFQEIINDALMPIFFLVVGLEIKREMICGELSSRSKAALPLIAAAGGMIAPSLIYIVINAGDPVMLRGWAIPAATDIAFAVGIMSLLGKRLPESLKIFLLALAIADDLGAILIIAIFYSREISLIPFGISIAIINIAALMNALGVVRLTPYLLTGIILWVCILLSGIHTTLAGVALALAVPMGAAALGVGQSPLERLEKSLHPWVSYGILPLFGFANAGVSLEAVTWSNIIQPVPLGVMLGLLAGKQLGVTVFSYLAIKTRVARLPTGATWAQFYGVAVITGIGFTMSLFIGSLAFEDGTYAREVKIGTIVGSVLSAIFGGLIIRIATQRAQK